MKPYSRLEGLVLAAAVVASFVGGAALAGHRDRKAESRATAQADRQHAQGLIDQRAAAAADARVSARTPQLAEAHAQAEKASGSFRHADAALTTAAARRGAGVPVNASSGPAVVVPKEVYDAAVADLAAARASTAALQDEVASQEAQLRDLTQARDAWRKTAGDYLAETVSLRQALRASDRGHLLNATLATYSVGPSGETRRGLEQQRDLGVLRLGVRVERVTMPTGVSVFAASVSAGLRW